MRGDRATIPRPLLRHRDALVGEPECQYFITKAGVLWPSRLTKFTLGPGATLFGQAFLLQDLFLAAGYQFDFVIRKSPIPNGHVIDQSVEPVVRRSGVWRGPD